MSAEEIMEINHLTNRYNQAADTGNGKAFAETFTEDGILEMPGSDPIVGRNALEVSGDSFPQLIKGVRHWINNQVVEINGNSATASCYLLLMNSGSPPNMMTTGSYSDELIKTDQGWKFTKRSVSLDS
tara:strand:+ start:3776 stop:4159 length:384 start_codon:yes stop_codon:yes gene_type:complete